MEKKKGANFYPHGLQWIPRITSLYLHLDTIQSSFQMDFHSFMGSGGQGNGQFKMPWNVAVDSENNVFVPDYGKE